MEAIRKLSQFVGKTFALWAALVFTTVALFIAAVATAKLYQGNNRLLLLRQKPLVRTCQPLW